MLSHDSCSRRGHDRREIETALLAIPRHGYAVLQAGEDEPLPIDAHWGVLVPRASEVDVRHVGCSADDCVSMLPVPPQAVTAPTVFRLSDRLLRLHWLAVAAAARGDEGPAVEALVRGALAEAGTHSAERLKLRERGRAQRLERIVREVHETLEQVPLASYARSLGRTPPSLCREFRRLVGCTLGSYRRGLRIAEAMRSLTADPELRRTDLALDLGFDSPAHFSFSFRRFAAMSPSQFATLAERPPPPAGPPDRAASRASAQTRGAERPTRSTP
jgi:AraC-like DNA-binding protein